MGDIILSSPCIPKENEEWPTPVRAIIRWMQRLGFSQREIIIHTGAPRRTIRDILHQEHSRRSRKGKVYKLYLMSVREIRCCICHIMKDWLMCWLSFEQVKAQLGVKASARTIRWELRRASYRRCIACPRPYISRKQAKKRLGFALEHRWWGTSDYAAYRDDGRHGGDWRKVIWSDEAAFEVGKSGRIWVIYWVDEKRCTDYI